MRSFFYSNEQGGRSMVELLGVLAVAGVLSITGVYGYQVAMDRQQMNNLLNETTLRATAISTQMQQEHSPSLAEFEANSKAIEGVSFKLSKPFDFENPPNSTDKQFALVLSGLPKKQCQNLFNSVGSGTAIREIRMRARSPMANASECTDNATMALVYNADLSSKEYLELMYNSEDCTNAGFYWCEDYGNGEQRCLENAALCCPSGGCGEGQTCRQGQCVECVEQQLDNGQTVCMADGDTVNCVGGYGTPYCTQCSASQGAVHCSSYSDSDSYRDYDHTPCVCGDNYDCSNYSCMNCPPDQKPICSDYVEWTTHGGGCTCAYTDENTQCNDYSQCMTCAQNETILCPEDSYGGGSCVCVPPDKKGACPYYYGNCIICEKGEEATCGEETCICHPNGTDAFCNYNGCVACGEDEKMICTGGYDYYKTCMCVPKDSNSACSTSYDDCGCGSASNYCITCPEGEKPVCLEGGYSCCEGGKKCMCVPEDSNAVCPPDTGSTTVANCMIDCTDGTAECNSLGCFCLTPGSSMECNSSTCKVCKPEEGTAMCSNSECICGDPERTVCTYNSCITCEEGEEHVCSTFGSCSCQASNLPTECNNFACITCQEGQEAVCPEQGECKCMDNGTTYTCSEMGCITCTAAQGTAKCPDEPGVPCSCVKEGVEYECGTSGCAKCIDRNGTTETVYAAEGTACTIYNQSGTCDGAGECVMPGCPSGQYASFGTNDVCDVRSSTFSCTTPSVTRREIIQGVEWVRSSGYMTWWDAEGFCKALGMRIPSRQYICGGTTNEACVNSQLRQILYDKFGYIGIHLEDSKDETTSAHQLMLYDGSLTRVCRSNWMWCCQGDYTLCYKP